MKPLHSASGTGIGYNPGISYRGGELLGAGLAQAGTALAEGLQQFTKNREEADALNVAFESRAQPILQDLQRKAAKDGQLDPAVEAIVDKGAKWHSLGTSQKKQILADVVMLGDRRERQQREEMDNKWKALAAERDVQQLGLQREQLGEQRRHTGVMEALGARAADRADSQAILDWQRFGASQAEQQRQVAALDAFSNLFQKQQALQASAPGVARPIDAEMLAGWGAATKAMSPGEIARLAEISARNQDPLARFQAETERMRAEAYRQQTDATSPWAKAIASWGKPSLQGRPIPGAPGFIDIGGKPFKVSETTAVDDVPDASKWRGWLSDLRAAKAAGKTKVDRSQLLGAGGVDTSPVFDEWFGGSMPIDDAIRAVEAKLGSGAAPASVPATRPTPVPANPGAKLTLEQAAQFRELAGGDVNKARELARKAGFTF